MHQTRHGDGTIRLTHGGARSGRALQPVAPAVVVLVMLLAFTLLSVHAEREVGALHRQVTRSSGPARDAAAEIQLQLALETAGTRGFLLTGDPDHRRRHLDARERRDAALSQLMALDGELHPGARTVTARLAEELRPADALLDSLHGGRMSRDEYMRRLPAQQVRLQRVTALVRELDQLVARHAMERITRLGAAQRRAMIATMVLVAIAAAAVVLVARLGMSFRALAEREAAAHAASEAARAEAVQRRHESEALAASRARLVRGFTHDVKNPLNAAAGYLELIQEGLLEPRDTARRARGTITHAVALIDELLQLERDRTTGIAVHPQPVDLRAVATDVVDDWRAAAVARGLAVATEMADGVPLVATDPERVRQVLGNFLSNAVRYTARGTITVEVETQPAGPGESCAWAVVAVRDTGPGLSAEARAGLFQEFRRLETAAGTRGTGIGLVSSQRIAEALGGRIDVASEPGVGSRFALLLPCAGIPADTASAGPPAGGTPPARTSDGQSSRR